MIFVSDVQYFFFMYFFNLSCFFDFFDFQFSFVEWSQVFTVCVFSLAPQHFENLHSKVVICTEQKTFIARVWFAQSSHRNIALPNRLCRFVSNFCVLQFVFFFVCVLLFFLLPCWCFLSWFPKLLWQAAGKISWWLFECTCEKLPFLVMMLLLCCGLHF